MKISLKISINKVVQVLVASDVALSAGWGFIAPIFAIFVAGQIEGANASVAGIAAGLYWIAKSVVQPFIANALDKKRGEIDDFYLLVAGLFVTGLVPLGYLFITTTWQLYGLELVHALAMACVVPTWAGIFTRHIDKDHEAFDWSVESTMLGFGAGVGGILGGILANTVGFQFVFILVSAFTMLSVVILFPVRPIIAPRVGKVARPEFKKPPFSHEKGTF